MENLEYAQDTNKLQIPIVVKKNIWQSCSWWNNNNDCQYSKQVYENKENHKNHLNHAKGQILFEYFNMPKFIDKLNILILSIYQ